MQPVQASKVHSYKISYGKFSHSHWPYITK